MVGIVEDAQRQVLEGGLQCSEGRARDEVERFIVDRFALMHQARVRHFMPTLLSMRGVRGEVLAACGLRDACTEALFLERYLQVPVEQGVSAAFGAGPPADRCDIVEVGNLAVCHPLSARDLIAALTQTLSNTSFRWTVFTALPPLRNAFRRLGIHVVDMGAAFIEALPESEWADWGDYYAGGPRVYAVAVADAAFALRPVSARAA